MATAKTLPGAMLLALLGCPADSEQLGDEIWAVHAGQQEPCNYPALYRSNMRVEYREYDKDCEVVVSRVGRLTDAGLAEYVAASAQASPGRLSSCLVLDGRDAFVLAFDGTETFEVSYCSSSTDHAAGRLAVFFNTLRAGLEACESHAWFDAC